MAQGLGGSVARTGGAVAGHDGSPGTLSGLPKRRRLDIAQAGVDVAP